MALGNWAPHVASLKLGTAATHKKFDNKHKGRVWDLNCYMLALSLTLLIDCYWVGAVPYRALDLKASNQTLRPTVYILNLRV